MTGLDVGNIGISARGNVVLLAALKYLRTTSSRARVTPPNNDASSANLQQRPAGKMKYSGESTRNMASWPDVVNRELMA